MEVTEEKSKSKISFNAESVLSSMRWGRSFFAYGPKERLKIIIGVNLILISIVSLIYTDTLVSKFEERERRQVNLYAQVLENAHNTVDNQDVTPVFSIIEEAHDYYQIPAIYVDDTGEPGFHNNIDMPENLSVVEQQAFLRDKIASMAQEHHPIPVKLDGDRTGYIYYSSSSLLTQLRFYPYIQLSGIFILVFLAYLAFSSTRKAEQNKVWVGLAKETAHQLGTPISSLIAWIEYFRADPSFDHSIADEMEKDVQRLEMITNRFSNIGSAPTLKTEDVGKVVTDFITYLQKRVSTKVEFSVINQLPPGQTAIINKNLFEWVFENICKNAVDAMGGVGKIQIRMEAAPKRNELIFDIRDTGKGISAANLRKLFNPGFSTKKRGWGLGLTLAKRIVENYHGGRIFVKSSEPGKGTTFRVIIATDPTRKIDLA
ncbi:ATP-binding protein [Ravibacter arvi]|uniref:histidine kinase n=1 Tax=Ravibacter arvi TaxID=2051041 RepID=A0ABP8LNY7_9BACT